MSETNPPVERPQADRRKNLRNPLPVLKVKVEENRRVFFGYARNISRSGFFITTLNPREVGDRFPVEMTLPEPVELTIRCQCEVVWNRNFSKGSPYEPGMGLKFNDLPEGEADIIDAWVHQVEETIKLAGDG